MNLLPTSDQVQILDSVAAFMSEQLPVTRYRELAEDELCVLGQVPLQQIVELGWFNLGLEEEFGGLGCSLVEDALMFREIGRQAGPLDIYAGALAVRLAALAGKDDIRDALISGQEQVALALSLGGSARATAILDGTVLLLGADTARYALLIDDQGAALFEPARLVGQPLPCIEFHQPLRELRLERTPASAFINADRERLIDRARLMLAAMQVGGAEASRDLAVDYAKQRVQFGRPIGGFQAIKHMCSDMAVRCEEAASQVFYASLALRDGHPDARNQAASAAYLATRAALENAAANIQVHGGMGMTAEVDAHHYLKRAHLLEELAGGSARLLDAVVAFDEQG